MIQLIDRAITFKQRKAVVSYGQSYSYKELVRAAKAVASNLLRSAKDLEEARVAFLIPPSFEYTAVQWGTWLAGGVAVPLCELHPLSAIEYVLKDTQATKLIAHPDYREFLNPLEEQLNLSLITLDELFIPNTFDLPQVQENRRAMILYTSGTTSKPKGVVTTHKIIRSQIQTLVKAWEWNETDYILNVLPLHHVHGIINVMSCALWAGACCEFLPKFSASKVWELFKMGKINVFMAVPTIYYKLISYWEETEQKEQELLSAAVSKFRLMVSGSAALPVPVLEKWRQISGQALLERYGMTEIGMGLSNSYRGERRPGHVGLPLPGVEILLVDEEHKAVDPGNPGEILIKSPTLFAEYWQKPAATQNAFTEDGWFKTGDTAVFNDGMYKILGRNSIDIIKSGGYKISALQIEDALRKHPDISDCAVIGVPDEEWGEIIAACIIADKEISDFEEIAKWLKKLIPGYQIPRKFLQLDRLPRNVLGKVTKNALRRYFKT